MVTANLCDGQRTKDAGALRIPAFIGEQLEGRSVAGQNLSDLCHMSMRRSTHTGR